MRPIHPSLLPHRVTVEPFTGDGPDGYLFGPPVQVRARVDSRPQIVAGKDGQQATSSATVILPIGAPVTLLSHITLPDGTRPRVLAVRTVHAKARPVYIEVHVQ